MSEIRTNPIVLYDGVCGLCNRLVQFILKRDKRAHFRFASLQSDFANKLLTRHGLDANDLDTVYLAKNYGQPDEKLLARSDAILFLLKQLGGIWKLAAVGHIVPRIVRDGMYELVARTRYQVFGKYDACMLPDAKDRAKFLDM
ncbi:MAG: thiol-disulfide oxidoreductase DCC family protein [Pyrinomonadaceae bacterium]